MLVDAPPELDGAQLPARACAAARALACARRGARRASAPARRRGVYVPFGGGEHDWAALELGAWLASATGAPLRLVGTRADPRSGRRDASRLLADASLAVQRVVDVDAAPVLADPDDALVEAVADAGARRRSGSRRAGVTRASAPPAARSSATRERRCCSSTAARARACSRRARAARASPGRSGHSPAPARGSLSTT